MAQPMICDGPDNDQAVILVQLLADVEVIALCGACAADWCQAYLQAVAPDRLARAPSKTSSRKRPAAAAAVADDGQGGAADA